jgi:hypothetical protein
MPAGPTPAPRSSNATDGQEGNGAALKQSSVLRRELSARTHEALWDQRIESLAEPIPGSLHGATKPRREGALLRMRSEIRGTAAFARFGAHSGLKSDIAWGLKSAKDGSAASREFSWPIPKFTKHLNVHAPFIDAYPWLSAQTLGVSRYVDAIVAMTPIVIAASAKLNTANDQAL